jgi:hypothetical protein
MANSAAKMLTGKDESAWRLNVLLPESEYRYLYALLTEHDPLSDTGKALVDRLTTVMGDKIDERNTEVKL